MRHLAVAADGTLSQVDAAPAGQFVDGLEVTPDGRSLYVASTGGYVWQYGLAGDGALVPKTPPRVAAGRTPAGLAVSPAVRVPTKDECKRGGWQHLGFENQGQCVASADRSARG